MIKIRSASLSDALELSAFAEKTFRNSFRDENSESDMALYVAKNFSESKQAAEIADSSRRMALATDGDDVIGYYHLRAGIPDASVTGPNPIELLRLYVDSRWQGKNVAHLLMQEAVDLSRTDGFATMWLGVWERNPRAQAFYKKWGFSEIGEHVFELGTDRQRDLIFTRPL